MGPYKAHIAALQSDFDEKQLQKKTDEVLSQKGKAQQYEKRKLALLNTVK